MTYQRLLKLGVLVLVIVALLRWTGGSEELPTAGGLSEGAARHPVAVALLAAIGIWGLGRAMSSRNPGVGD